MNIQQQVEQHHVNFVDVVEHQIPIEPTVLNVPRVSILLLEVDVKNVQIIHTHQVVVHAHVQHVDPVQK